MPKSVANQFKSLNYYIHQNILLLIDLIIDKLPQNEISKDWMGNLKQIIDNKLSQMAVKTLGLNSKQHSKMEIIAQN